MVSDRRSKRSTRRAVVARGSRVSVGGGHRSSVVVEVALERVEPVRPQAPVRLEPLRRSRRAARGARGRGAAGRRWRTSTRPASRSTRRCLDTPGWLMRERASRARPPAARPRAGGRGSGGGWARRGRRRSRSCGYAIVRSQVYCLTAYMHVKQWQESVRPERTRAAVERAGAATDPPYVRRSLGTRCGHASPPLRGRAGDRAVDRRRASTRSRRALTAPRSRSSPATIAPGAHAHGPLPDRGPRRARVRVRLDLLPEAGGRPVGDAAPRPAAAPNRDLTASWRPQLAARPLHRPPARHRARGARARRARRPRRRSRSQRRRRRDAGVFPVQGAYGFGGAGRAVRRRARGPRRTRGRTSSPPPGRRSSRRAPGSSAGARTRPTAPATTSCCTATTRATTSSCTCRRLGRSSRRARRSRPAQRLGAVGATGHADGPHLHFEIWPDGWYASKGSKPIDPLPDLLAWAAAG